MIEAKTNRNHKDSVFTRLFSEKSNLLELYSAISGKSYHILLSFLDRHSSEVENMIFGEWNWDDAKQVWQEEAREDTLEETAKSMLKEGLDVVLIERITKLPKKEILALR